MKIAVECHSPLLQKSLEIFLKEYLSSKKNADVTLCDFKQPDMNKRIFISQSPDSTLKKPFSRAELFLMLEKYFNLQKTSKDKTAVIPKKIDFSKISQQHSDTKEISSLQKLEEKIMTLTQNYQNQLIEAVRDYHDKK